MARPDPKEEGVTLADVQEWDRLNALALGKLKFYLTDTIYKIVWKGDKLTALEFYERLFGMFLRRDMQNKQMLEDAM